MASHPQGGKRRKAARASASDSPEGPLARGIDVPDRVDLEPPASRPLKAYAFDPSQGRLLGNEMSIEVRYRDLAPGPIERGDAPDRIAVVDYDGATRRYYKPVDLDDPWLLIRGGLAPSESDPRFHQQMVYAVASETIQHFEAALGRPIHWRREERPAGAAPAWMPGDIQTLHLFPHASRSPNAFYSPDAGGILFGYFKADRNNPGRNLPGQTVFTCLSHDIVVHETTHAIIDGLRGLFTEQTNLDVAAFHEAFADLAALFRHFAHEEVLLDTIQRTGGQLYRYQLKPDATSDAGATPADLPAMADGGKLSKARITAEIAQRNPLIELAQQFGEASGMYRGLRSALGTPPRADDIKKLTEPHQRGSILVAAVFDAFFSIYVKRTTNLFRIFRAGGGSANPEELPAPLAELLSREAVKTAEEFFSMCVRALDYCPPVDITFGDFLRAIITADTDIDPSDREGKRDALMQAFRLRGIYPDGARFFSEGAIAWPRAETLGLPPVHGLDIADPSHLTAEQKNRIGPVLKAYVEDPSNKKKLGFALDLPVRIPSHHTVFRVLPGGRLRTDMVVELVQTRQEHFDGKAGRLGRFPLRGGAALVLTRSGPGQAVVRYVIDKQIRGEEGELRLRRQKAHLQQLGLVEGDDPKRFRIDFALVHGGM